MKLRSYFVCFLALLLAAQARPSAQQSRCVFDAASVQLDPYVPPFRRMIDLDLDGDPDAVGVQATTNWGVFRLYSYANDGQGLFGRVWNGTVNTNTSGAGKLLIEVGHLNADVWPDVCIVYRTRRYDWYGNGIGGFTNPVSTSLPAHADALALADLDSDGIDDAIWLDNSALRVAVSSGVSTSIAVPGVKHGLRVLVRDGPVSTDIFLVHTGNELRLFYGSTAGLVAGQVFSHGVAQSMVDTGDVDGDGDLDAVVFGPASYRVLRRSGPGSWTLEALQSGGPAEFLRDVDGDGDLDGVCCGGGGGGGGSTYADNIAPSDFRVALNDGQGGFAPAFALRGVGSPQLAGALDVDGDGDVDLVAGRCVYFADGPLVPPTDLPPPPVQGRRDLSDCDGDGDLDVGFSLQQVYDNDGSGLFTPQATSLYPPPAGFSYRGPGFPGDFDGDGDVDLLVEVVRAGHAQALPDGLSATGLPVAMVLLPNQGTGALLPGRPASHPGVSFALGALTPETSLLVDADLDGDLDLLTRSTHSPGSTRLWANEGIGFFHGGGQLTGERVAWAGDVDLDGDLDLITSSPGTSSEIVHLYMGSLPVAGRLPTLTLSTSFGGWSYSVESGISVADFDQIGYPDFVITTDSGFYEVLALNNAFPSGGSLSANVTLDSDFDLAPGARVEVGDLNGDGIDDVLVGPHDELAAISELHFKRSVGHVSSNGFDMLVQMVPAGLLVDIDGDGDLDVLGQSIVLNRGAP